MIRAIFIFPCMIVALFVMALASGCATCAAPMSFNEWKSMDQTSKGMSVINPLYAAYSLFD